MNSIKYSLAISLGVVAFAPAFGEIMDRPSGIKIGERMTLRPYVSVSLSYDHNVNGRGGTGASGNDGDFMWTISPTLSLDYKAEQWSLLLNGHYNYNQYFRNDNRDESYHNFGESLRWNWSSSTGADKGWSVMIGQLFDQRSMADDMISDNGGHNYGGGSRQLTAEAGIQRRFNEKLHGSLHGSYYWLNRDGDKNDGLFDAFYGWSRWTVGAQAGYAVSPWLNFQLSGSYQGFTQENTDNTDIDGNSRGLSVQGGITSYMTERISYSVLAGWSRFSYGDGESTSDGFVYTISGNWKIGESWNTMLMASSYYQPSEYEQASKTRTDAISWGLSKTMVRGKLRATLDVRYNRNTNESVDDSYDEYVLNVLSGRLGLNYSFNRYLSVFVNGEYQRSFNSDSDNRNGAYDYDRWRISAGFGLSY